MHDFYCLHFLLNNCVDSKQIESNSKIAKLEEELRLDNNALQILEHIKEEVNFL